MHTGTKPKKCERGSPEPLLQHLTLWSLGPLLAFAPPRPWVPEALWEETRLCVPASYNKLGID